MKEHCRVFARPKEIVEMNLYVDYIQYLTQSIVGYADKYQTGNPKVFFPRKWSSELMQVRDFCSFQFTSASNNHDQRSITDINNLG